MTRTAYHGRALGALLIREGLCPPNARDVSVHVPADGPVVMRFEVFVGEADLPRLARALVLLLQEPAPTNGGDGPAPPPPSDSHQ